MKGRRRKHVRRNFEDNNKNNKLIKIHEMATNMKIDLKKKTLKKKTKKIPLLVLTIDTTLVGRFSTN